MRNGLLTFLLFFSLSANASMFGEENLTLAQMVAQLELIYTQTVEMVKKATVANETFTKINNVVKTAKEGYDAVKNSFLWDIEGMLAREFEDLQDEFDFSGLTIEQQIDKMTNLVDRRIRNTNDPAERKILKEKKAYLKKQEFLLKLEQAAAENLKKASGGLTDKEASQNIAINSAIQAQMATRREQRAIENEDENLGDAIFVNKVLKANATLARPRSER
jgi:hypothetical protein